MDSKTRRDIDRPPIAELGLLGRAADEDHVDIADVVQLPRAGLPHPDDRESRFGDLLAREQRRPGGDPRAGHSQRSLQRGSGEVRQRGRNRGHDDERVGCHQVERRDRRQQAPVAHSQRHPG